MDGRDRPTPPNGLDPDLRAFLEALAGEDVETVRSVAAYADDLAAWKATVRDDGPSTDDDGDDSLPDGVPERAGVTVTEIDGTEYRYYQWREGDRVRSKIERR